MKKTIAIALVLLALAGCAPGAREPLDTTEAATETIPNQTELIPPETAAPTQTEEPTEAPTEETQPFVAAITPVITGDQTQVTVSTVDAFLAAIAPDTEIIVDAPLLDLSEATGYGETDGEYYYWYESFDGPELHICNVSNLTIRGGGETHGDNVISCVPRYAHVLTFENCANIYVLGFTAGHTKEPGSCEGGVLKFLNSQDILVEDCGLFGCGTVGVTGMSSKNMQIVNNEIYECSIGGLELSYCKDVNVDGNSFRDLGGPIFRLFDCENITSNGGSAKPFT